MILRSRDFKSEAEIPLDASAEKFDLARPGDDEKGPVGPARNDTVGQKDDGAISPRTSLVAVLTRAIAAATAAGDLHAARVAHEALGRLLDEPAQGGAPVADLRSMRERRGR
jgi:hypothetical protein